MDKEWHTPWYSKDPKKKLWFDMNVEKWLRIAVAVKGSGLPYITAITQLSAQIAKIVVGMKMIQQRWLYWNFDNKFTIQICLHASIFMFELV